MCFVIASNEKSIYRSLNDLILQLKKEFVNDEAFVFYVKRECVLKDALRRMHLTLTRPLRYIVFVYIFIHYCSCVELHGSILLYLYAEARYCHHLTIN